MREVRDAGNRVTATGVIRHLDDAVPQPPAADEPSRMPH